MRLLTTCPLVNTSASIALVQHSRRPPFVPRFLHISPMEMGTVGGRVRSLQANQRSGEALRFGFLKPPFTATFRTFRPGKCGRCKVQHTQQHAARR
jgi:hypothetical protein